MSNQHNLNAVLLAGIARSGTTWLSNILNYDKRYRSLFEPFHPDQGIKLAEPVTNAMYLRPETQNDTLKQGFVDLLSGNIINEYVDQDNKGDYGDRILMKSIRLNSMLPWLQANLPEVPIVYIARHPASVITSQARLGWDASEINVKRFLRNDELIEDYLAPYVDLMKSASDGFDYRLFFWCANNVIVHQHFQNNEIYIVYYEQLKREPIEEARKMFEFLGQSLDEEALAKVVMKPSRTTWRADTLQAKFHWSNMLTSAQQKKMWQTLEAFGLSDIYNEDNAPRLSQTHLRKIGKDTNQTLSKVHGRVIHITRITRKHLSYRINRLIRPELTQLRQPVFIVGCGRSGTTILGQVLGKHPQITYFNEPRDIWLNEPSTDIWSSEAGKRSGKLHLNAKDVNINNIGKIIDEFAYRAYKQGKRQLVEKLPINSFRIEFIRAIFPDARFIHLIRHGVAVAQSIERETIKYDWFGANDYKWHLLADYARSQGLDALVEQAESDMRLRGLLEWRLSVSTALQALDSIPDSDKITVRYEQLLAEPETIIKQLEAFIGVDPDTTTENFARETIKNNKKDQQISPEVQAIAGELLTQLGYA